MGHRPPPTIAVTLSEGSKYLLLEGLYSQIPQEYVLSRVTLKGYKLISLATGRARPIALSLYVHKEHPTCKLEDGVTLCPREGARPVTLKMPIWLEKMIVGVFE